MSVMENCRINLSAPNLLNICVDEKCQGEIEGRMYHCYSEEPVHFANVIELIREAEKLFDTIAFPQASTRTRRLAQERREEHQPVQPVRGGMPVVRDRKVTPADVVSRSGRLGTFVTHVRYRQNATWQGEFFWIEKETKKQFSNLLDFIRQIDEALGV